MLARARGVASTGDPGPPVVRRVALPQDAGVDPYDVALPQHSVGRRRGIGEIAVGGPRALLLPRRHDLPDRVDATRRGTELEGTAQEAGAQVALADTRPQRLPCADHGQLGDALRGADAGQLVGGLAQLGRRQGGTPVTPVVHPEGPQHGVGLVVDGQARTGGEVIGQRPEHVVDAVVQVGEERPMDVVRRPLGREPVASSGVDVRSGLPLGHDDHWTEDAGAPAVLTRHRQAGGVGDRTGAQQHQAVKLLAGQLLLQPGEPLAPHARQVGAGGNLPPADRGARRLLLHRWHPRQERASCQAARTDRSR